MDINKTIERKRSEIAKLEAEIEALETAHKIMVDEFAERLGEDTLTIEKGTISWSVNEHIKREEEVNKIIKDSGVADSLRKFSQL